MRTQIETWLRDWFHFNRRERRGIVPLLLLMVLLQATIWALNTFETDPKIQLEITSLPSDSGAFHTNAKGAHSVRQVNHPNNFQEKNKFTRFADTSQRRKAPASINLNRTDSSTLELLPGIGPVMAGKIIRYRNQLGGFRNLLQLTEIRGFREDLLFDLEGRIYVLPDSYQRIPLNTVALEDLRRHPYFKYTLSRALVNYRDQHGPFQKMEDLRQIKIVSDSIYNLITPYLSLPQ